MDMVMIGIIVFVVLLILYAVVAYNGLVKLRNKVKTNWAQIDVVLKRRADVIPNLVETVKGYASHEKETLQGAIEARSKYMSAATPEQQMEAAGELTQTLSKLVMLQEAYPDLKANTNFLQLQKTLEETENKIQYARQFYNDSVYQYTNKTETFPSVIIAKFCGFKPFAFFEVAPEDSTVPQVKF